MLKKFSFIISLLIVTVSNGVIADTSKQKIAIVISSYHQLITEKLLEGATACLYKNGIQAEDISVAYVPGSYEIPLAVKLLAQTKHFEAIICLGAIITSNNPQWNCHADHVSKNIAQVSLTFDVPVTWGIFLFDSKEQAQKDVNQLENNRGWEAAQAALTMISLSKQIKKFASELP